MDKTIIQLINYSEHVIAEKGSTVKRETIADIECCNAGGKKDDKKRI